MFLDIIQLRAQDVKLGPDLIPSDFDLFLRMKTKLGGPLKMTHSKCMFVPKSVWKNCFEDWFKTHAKVY